MPRKDSIRWISDDMMLTFEEVSQVTKVLVSLGIKKVRITGGEPLLREGIDRLIAMVSPLPGIETLDMTTNGWFLAKKAKVLRNAGLHGVTISLHSTRRDRFAKIAGIDALPRVLEGIDAACEAGFTTVKINFVAIRGYNDDEIVDIVKFAREKNLSIRFIEFMPLDGLGGWSPDRVMSGKEIISKLSKHFELVPKERIPGDTATMYGFKEEEEGDNSHGKVGLITPISEPFCDDCDRIRLLSDGKLLTCLFDTNYYDLKPLIREKKALSAADIKKAAEAESEIDARLATYIVNCISKKPGGIQYIPAIRNLGKPMRAMHAIGG